MPGRSHQHEPLKWYKSIRVRFFMAFSAMVACIAIFIYLYFPTRLRDQALANTQGQALSFAEFLAFSVSPALDFQDSLAAEESMNAAEAEEQISFVVVTNAKGKTFASYGHPEALQEDFSDVGPGRLSKDGSQWLTSTSVNSMGAEIGRVYLGISLDKMKLEVSRSQQWIALVSLVTLIVGVVLVYSISSVLTRNLSQIVNVVNQIGAGDFSQRAPVTTHDEIGLLAQSFNSMVSDLEDSTQALRKREAQFRNLAENMNEGLLQMDRNLVIRYANPRMCKILNHPEEYLVGKHIRMVIGDENLPHFLDDGTNHQSEIQYRNDEGQQLWLLLSYSFGSDYKGERSITVIFTDITILKKTERDLVYKNRELDTFVYKASHDLKAPLSSMRGLVDIALSEIEDPAGRQYLQLIDRTVLKMDDVLQGLLEVTWIKQGALDPTSIHLRDFVQTILRSIEHAPGYSTVNFKLNVPDRYHIVSDAKILNSILQNLIFNAIKYHREEGDEKWVALTVTDLPRSVKISVSDNGPGIPAQAQDRLFDMFFRASTKSKGSGLGLYIVKTSVEKMGGSVSLSSEEGKGTEFVVEMPKILLPGPQEVLA